jgi:predicted polyphosphate/ATP-dependent NAD kinase
LSKVGIIANPASGKDIRRLVSQATVISNAGKIDVVKRLILGLDATGVDEVLVMPDPYAIGLRAIQALDRHLSSVKVRILDLDIQNDPEDSIRATQMMREERVACIITLGGDGTNRVVSKACGPIPLLPISTGTNNVFPVMTEGTTAGMAAGILARKIVEEKKVTSTMKKLILLKDQREVDIALIDLVVLDHSFIGAKALWEMNNLKMIFLTMAEPGVIGISSIGAALRPLRREAPLGLLIELGPGGNTVRAPIAPGLIRDVGVKNHRLLRPGERVSLPFSSFLIALDGEREIEVPIRKPFEVTLGMDGPKIAHMDRILKEATAQGFFLVNGKRTQKGRLRS